MRVNFPFFMIILLAFTLLILLKSVLPCDFSLKLGGGDTTILLTSW